jgi:hypothetical protein
MNVKLFALFKVKFPLQQFGYETNMIFMNHKII